MTIQDPKGVPLNEVMDLLEGRKSLPEFMQSRRTANVIVTRKKP